MHRRSRHTASILLAVLAAGSVARVARAEPTDLERARTLFDEAGELEQKGQWTAAQDRLRAALRIRETPHLRYALGWALENGDRLIEARTEYEVALRLGQRAGIEEVSRLAASRITEVDRKIPLLQIHVRGALARDTHILVDGREIIVRGDVGTVSVDPGARHVRVERRGKTSTEESVTMAPGVFRVIEVPGDQGAVVAEPGNVPAQVADTRGKGVTLPWILIAGGGALALGGIVLFVSSSSDASARNDNLRQWCDATACVGGTTATRAETPEAAAFRREAYDSASRGNTKQVAGAILGGVGVVGIATGAYLLLSKRERDDTPPHLATTRVHVDAAPLAGGALAGASLTF